MCVTHRSQEEVSIQKQKCTPAGHFLTAFTVLIFCWRNESWGKWKCHFFVFLLTEKYKIRVKSIPDSSSSQKGFFSDTDIVNVILCCCEETVLGVIRYLAPLPNFLQTVEQNSFSGEPQLLRIISKGIKCTTILYIKPLPHKPAILIISSYQPTMTSDIYCWFLSIYFLSNNTPFPFLLMNPTQICSLLSNYWGPDVCSVW